MFEHKSPLWSMAIGGFWCISLFRAFLKGFRWFTQEIFLLKIEKMVVYYQEFIRVARIVILIYNIFLRLQYIQDVKARHVSWTETQSKRWEK